MALAPSYAEWVERKPGKKDRRIPDPRGDTEKVHYRIYELLDRVRRPVYLHSATRHRSNVTNARAHLGSVPCVTTDMKACYESTTIFQVQAFYEKALNITPDVAWKLAGICTVRGHLPTGSCLSPLLAYWSHREVFDKIEALCDELEVTMTLYVDDLTFSGVHANLSLLHKFKDMLRGVGIQTHKEKQFGPRQVKHVTGVAITPKGLAVENRKLRAIVVRLDELLATEPIQRTDVAKKLTGQIAAASAISKRTANGLRARRSRLLSTE